MEQIKQHIDAAYAQLHGMVVGGDAKIPIGLAMAELTMAMDDIVAMEKEKSKEKSEGKDAPA